MSAIKIVIMIIGGIGAFVGMNKSKEGATWGQPLAIVCAIIAIVAALWSSIGTMTGGGQSSMGNRETQFQTIQTQKLGQYLAEKHSGAKAVLILDPLMPDTAESPNAAVKGLKLGIGSAISIVKELAPELPEAYKNKTAAIGDVLPPVESWYTAKALDALLKDAGDDYDMIITFMGLPARFAAPKGKKIVFAAGNMQPVPALIKSGACVAAVAYLKDAQYDDKPVPKDFNEAFNKRYVLVTPENIGEVIDKFNH